MKENNVMERKLETGPKSAGARSHVTLNEINQLAYRKWSAAGSPPGDCTRFWLEAEHDLVEEPSPSDT
jgi:Protein of unknown function (DUF2934)